MQSARQRILACIVGCLGALALLASPALARPKTDVVKLSNGDVLNCAIVQLTQGKLKVKTDGFGTVDIKWDRVVSMTSVFYFRIQTSRGDRYFGTPTMEDGVLRLERLDVWVTLERAEIVEIRELERGFWSKMDGSFSLSSSYTKSSQVAQLSTAWENIYRDERNNAQLNVSLSSTDNRDSDRITRRNTASLAYNRLLRSIMTGGLSVSLERNDELGVAQRILTGINTGANPIRSNTATLFISIGLNGNWEVATDSVTTTESLEAALTTSYRYFLYDSPKTTFNFEVDLYPNLSEQGRWRSELDISASRELVKNFTISASYYNSYDSDAAGNQGVKSDYGYTLGIGWTYNR